MSDGINICFGNANFECPETESIANLLSSAKFKLPFANEQGHPHVHADSLSKGSAAELLASSCRDQTKLQFIESPYEYFSLSFFSDGEFRDCVLLSTDTRTQTRNTLEKLGLNGFTFLDLIVALAECFCSDCFADTESGDLAQLKLGVFSHAYPPTIAYNIHVNVTEAMLENGMNCWDTGIGKVWGLRQWHHPPEDRRITK